MKDGVFHRISQKGLIGRKEGTLRLREMWHFYAEKRLGGLRWA